MIYKNMTTKGFTLIELLMVMGVIGALAGVLMIIINPTEVSRKSRDARRISDMGSVKTAIDLALSDGQALTATSGWVTFSNSTSPSSFDGSGLDVSKYISVIPQNPGGNTQYVNSACATGATSASDMAYQYKSDGSVYVIRTKVESVSNCKTIQSDGNSSDYYELGTDPGLNL